MRFDILTLFPNLVENYCSESILKRARKAGLIDVRAHNFRDYTKDKHNRVDARPYGGGPGMVLQVQPIFDCLKAIKAVSLRGVPKGRRSNPTGLATGLLRRYAPRNDTKIIILDPAGKKFDQRMAEKFAKLDRLILICGRYEGFDERIYKLADEKISVGDYVLSGGELPALIVAEAVARLIPGVLGNEESLKEETFIVNRNLKLEIGDKRMRTDKKISSFQFPVSFKEYPQYTRPENFMGMKAPKILLSGNHALIENWRKKKSK